MRKNNRIWVFILLACLLLQLVGTSAMAAQDAADISADDVTQEDLRVIGEPLTPIDLTKLQRDEAADLALDTLLSEREIMAVVYLCDTMPLRQQATCDADSIAEIPCGQTVFLTEAFPGEDGELWTRAQCFLGDTVLEGYLPRANLALSDERFLAWEQEYYDAAEGLFAKYLAPLSGIPADIAQFPESYQSSLMNLKNSHPAWVFVPMKTGLDWNTVIKNELSGGRSLIGKSAANYVKDGAYDDGNWFYASKEVLEQYMDPRNSLGEQTVFQFEQLTYNESYHTEQAVANFLNGTFMNSSKNAPGTAMTYAHIFWAIGAEEGRRVSPFHLAARVLQEQGKGESALISGTYPGYEGYYNYFNVGATGTTQKAIIENGLAYAKKQNPPWNNAYFSILGGADVISANYIKRGQDTLYLQKFNVNPNGYYGLYSHQYMQNIAAPTSESRTIASLYGSVGALNSPFVFKIPVYENMPEKACPVPTGSTKIYLEIPEGFPADKVCVDGVFYPVEKFNGRTYVRAADFNAKTAVLYRVDESDVPRDMFVYLLEFKDGLYSASESVDFRNALTYHGFSVRITGNSGIRFKTGISADLRKRLLDEGVNGYRVKEYGTLIMNTSNMAQYPMVKGGQKVVCGVSYGMDGTEFVDRIYETVDGRDRFTGVLINIPANRYKASLAFRGYLELEKNGQSIVLYGPIKTNSIYDLSVRLIRQGSYAEGSSADLFLRKIISDADALETDGN